MKTIKLKLLFIIFIQSINSVCAEVISTYNKEKEVEIVNAELLNVDVIEVIEREKDINVKILNLFSLKASIDKHLKLFDGVNLSGFLYYHDDGSGFLPAATTSKDIADETLRNKFIVAQKYWMKSSECLRKLIDLDAKVKNLLRLNIAQSEATLKKDYENLYTRMTYDPSVRLTFGKK
jgi:hypothetical protein